MLKSGTGKHYQHVEKMTIHGHCLSFVTNKRYAGLHTGKGHSSYFFLV